MASKQKVDVIALCQKDLRMTKAVKDFMAKCDSTLEGTDLAKYAAPKYPMVLRAASALIIDSENQRVSAAQNLGLAAYAVDVSEVWKEPLDGKEYKSYTNFVKEVFADHDGDNLINYAAAYRHFGKTALYGKYSLGALKELVSLVNTDRYGYKDKGELIAAIVEEAEQKAGRKLTYRELRDFADKAKGKIKAKGKVVEKNNATVTTDNKKESARLDKGKTTAHDFGKLDSDRAKAEQAAEDKSKSEKDKINAWYQGVGERFIRGCSAIDNGQKDVVISIRNKMYVVTAYKQPKEVKPGGTARKRNNKVKQQESTRQASTQQASTQQASTQQASTQQASTQQASMQQESAQQ